MIGSFRHRFIHLSAVIAVTTAAFASAHAASVCPFDTGGSHAINDGVVLTRYALGITGAPMTASTRYASLDPLQVKANIECVGSALDISGDGVEDTVDTTIIARHLSGFTGASLTAGLALGTATTASVVSFLANGCAVGGAINAFVRGGNTFALGAGVASELGNNDNRPLTIKAPQSTIKLLVDPANGDDRLRISYGTESVAISPNTINGSRANSVAAGVVGATIGGGGIAFGQPNQVNAIFGTIGGGRFNHVTSQYGTVGGGFVNAAGSGSNAQSAQTVAGGSNNAASGEGSTVPGGVQNKAFGDYSFAAGRAAQANHRGAFVWSDSNATWGESTGENQFGIRAAGGIRLPGAGENEPGNSARQSGTNMFTHVVPASGPCRSDGPFGLSRTAIDHPLTNSKPDAILVVTPNIGVRSTSTTSYGKTVNVMYDDDGGSLCTVPAVGRWMIVNPSGDQNMVAGMKFNLFVINP